MEKPSGEVETDKEVAEKTREEAEKTNKKVCLDKKMGIIKITVKKIKKLCLFKEEDKVISLGETSNEPCNKHPEKPEKILVNGQEPPSEDRNQKQQEDNCAQQNDKGGLPHNPTTNLRKVAYKKNYSNLECCILDGKKTPWSVKCHKSINHHNPQIDVYLKGEHARNVILHSRYMFEALSKKKKAPYRKATTFKNHLSRLKHLKDRNRMTHKNPRFPPNMPFVVFTFADQMLLDVCHKFDPENDAVIMHKKLSSFIVLRKDKCGEHAMEELLSVDPVIYDSKRRQSSKCVEPSPKEWLPENLKTPPLDCTCRRPGIFVVDFSVIYPEDKMSTAFVTCNQCGVFGETILSDYTKVMIKKDLEQNLVHWEMKGPKSLRHERSEGNEPTNQNVMVFPTRDIHFKESDPCGGVAFKEGIMGFTPCLGEPLKPSVLVRVRVTYYCNGKTESNVIDRIHDCTVFHK